MKRTVALLTIVVCWGTVEAVPVDAPQFEFTLVDGEAHGYATFQSHNQKVVANQNGIFMTHLQSRNEAYTAQTWRLSRSTDAGQSFETIFEETSATNPPVLETDKGGTLYLVRADFVDGDAYLYRFSAGSDYRTPEVSRIPRGAAGKYAMILDESREQLFYFAHNNTFHTIALDGTIIETVDLLKGGANGVLQYPLVALTDDGALHAAWTTQKHDVYLYWDIHHMFSPDGGKSWKNLGGAALSPPIIADNSGPTTRLTLDDEFEAHTWLSSFAAKADKLHFMYLAQTNPPRQHYVRYGAESGAREADIQPRFGDEHSSIQSLDGFFATAEDAALYAVGSNAGNTICLISRDNGVTWNAYAQSDERFNVYSLGGARRITGDGYIIGTFTDSGASNDTTDRNSKVYFFRLATTP